MLSRSSVGLLLRAGHWNSVPPGHRERWVWREWQGKAVTLMVCISAHLHDRMSHQTSLTKYKFNNKMIRNYKGQQKNISQTCGPLNTPVSLCKLYISACRSWSANIAKCWGLEVCGSITLDWNQRVAVYTMLCLGPWWNNTVTKDLKRAIWMRGQGKPDQYMTLEWDIWRYQFGNPLSLFISDMSFVLQNMVLKVLLTFLKYTLFMEYFKFCLKGEEFYQFEQ